MSDEWIKIGEQFLQQFFSSSDINVRFFDSYQHYANYYASDSILSVEKKKFVGTNDIATKLSSVPGAMQVNTHEIQPSNNGIIIFMSGLLQLQGEKNAFPFCRVFFLTSNQNGNIYVKNDMYKLTLG